jgi:hypothetical protein
MNKMGARFAYASTPSLNQRRIKKEHTLAPSVRTVQYGKRSSHKPAREAERHYAKMEGTALKQCQHDDPAPGTRMGSRLEKSCYCPGEHKSGQEPTECTEQREAIRGLQGAAMSAPARRGSAEEKGEPSDVRLGRRRALARRQLPVAQ